jgi:hypothetical protein
MEFVQQGTTTVSNVYCEMLKKNYIRGFRICQCSFTYSCLHWNTAGTFQLEVVSTVGYSCEQRWFNHFIDIQAQQDAPTQD